MVSSHNTSPDFMKWLTDAGEYKVVHGTGTLANAYTIPAGKVYYIVSIISLAGNSVFEIRECPANPIDYSATASSSGLINAVHIRVCEGEVWLQNFDTIGYLVDA